MLEQGSSTEQHCTSRSERSLAERSESFYIPSLDGIRTVAFLLVFLSHQGWQMRIPGTFGVTVFFFLSGYLITSLLRREYERTGQVDLRVFYYRRAFRILPPMFITFFASILLSFLGVLPNDLRLEPALYQAAFMTNYYMIFGAYIEGIPTGCRVFWSLAVEEHFYLIFPLLFIGLVSRARKITQVSIYLTICAAILVWRCVLFYGYDTGWERIYHATDTRLDSILFGCILGVYLNPYMDLSIKFRRVTKVALYLLAGALILFCFVYKDPGFRNTLRYSLQGIALLIIFYFVVQDHKSWWFSWLNWKPIRFLGWLSYSFYLTHQVVIFGVKYHYPEIAELPLLIVTFGLTFLCSLAMYYWVEKPSLVYRRKYKPAPRPHYVVATSE